MSVSAGILIRSWIVRALLQIETYWVRCMWGTWTSWETHLQMGQFERLSVTQRCKGRGREGGEEGVGRGRGGGGEGERRGRGGGGEGERRGRGGGGEGEGRGREGGEEGVGRGRGGGGEGGEEGVGRGGKGMGGGWEGVKTIRR